MEEMMRKFKDEFKSVYNLYLEAGDLVENIDKYPENYDKDDKDSAWTRFKRKSGQVYELRKNLTKIIMVMYAVKKVILTSPKVISCYVFIRTEKSLKIM